MESYAGGAREARARDRRAGGAPHAAHGLRSWLTTVDHKRIGILYLVLTLFFFLVGGLMALAIRIQLETADGKQISPEMYDQIFTMHGTTMIFLFVVPVMAAFGNYLVPLQIGARDMAFPRLNAASFWLLLFGGVLLYSSFLFGGGARRRLDGLPAAVGAVARPWASTSGSSACTWSASRPWSGRSTSSARSTTCARPGCGSSRMPLFTWAIDVYVDHDPGRRSGAGGRADDAPARPQLRDELLRPGHGGTSCSTSTCSGSTRTRWST